MAGHSKFKNIMYRKGAQDAKRAKLFSKMAREITVAAKSGIPEAEKNPRLRNAIISARAENMPKDRIEKAIQKATGENDETSYEEIRYEGYGPGSVAVIIDVLTDNRNRTASEIRSAFSKNGGSLSVIVPLQLTSTDSDWLSLSNLYDIPGHLNQILTSGQLFMTTGPDSIQSSEFAVLMHVQESNQEMARGGVLLQRASNRSE